ncbi:MULTISPECIES: glycosyltransferase family 39 protein [unclassified Micromonospora]|uniref:glycosyltransferase family 39 protein n=1 Tax=unclassified Micromonospora TaxID=2617518 RepID=UPI00118258D9|nr:MULTISPECIES: glycosyltransferase family 39 protein [unclassified Micromonospora]MDI5937583.1 glycosyltransferase family 39 protein [Micromonospora sp. DH15]
MSQPDAVTAVVPGQRRDHPDGPARRRIPPPAAWLPALTRRRWAVAAALTAIGGLALLVRSWRIDLFGFNSDEVVYAGQAASLAGNPGYADLFPVFRAHPMLFQALLSPLLRVGEVGMGGRWVVAAIGVLTVLAVYPLGARLYGRRVGLLAALLLAVMPYHVIVTRQILLDGPMVLLSTLTLYCMVRYVQRQELAWYLATAGMLGLTMLAKETSVVLAGSVYAFLALTPRVRRPVRATLLALPVLAVVFAAHPVSQALAGGSNSGRNYLVWQLFRRPNHPMSFYLENVPTAMGVLLLVAAAGGLWWARRRNGWRETLLLSWIAVPVVFFQLWPVKGFQYLLPVAVPVVLLGARALVLLPVPTRLRWPGRGGPARPVPARAGWLVRLAAVGLVASTLAASSWDAVSHQGSSTFLAGSGGVPGGREAGHWITEHTPEGSVILTLGPSMSNIVRFYSQRQSYGLSVSPNPLHRNPSYVPLNNPDGWLRNNNLHYVVWDSFSARRSPFFADRLMTLVRRYHGRVVHTEYVGTTGASGRVTPVPVVVVYEVRP